MKRREEPDPLSRYATLEVGVGLLGIVGAYYLPPTGEGRLGAMIGVATSILSAGVVLALKKGALHRSMEWALAVIGVGFLLRMVALLVGLAVVMRMAAGRLEFVLAFLGVYVLCMCLEIAYVLAERERGSGGM